MVAFPQARLVELPNQGVTLAVYEQGSGPAVVFSHGFPELAYSWRYQLPAVAAAGFRAIAPDQRGYGASSRPQAISQYGMRELTGDLVAILDAFEIDKAIFVGHDWGGLVAWGMPVLHPTRVAGVVGICTPYLPMPPIDLMLAMVDGEVERHYIAWFQAPGVAEGKLDKLVPQMFEKLLRGGMSIDEMMARAFVDGKLDMNPFRRIDEMEPMGQPIVSQEELQTYIDAFERTGFGGGINWYRNISRNIQEYPEIGVRPLSIPCLMLTAEWDAALRPEFAEPMKSLCSDLEVHMIRRAGHWVQQEFPNEVNHHLTDWLKRRFI